MSTTGAPSGNSFDARTDITAAVQAGDNLNNAQENFAAALTLTDDSNQADLAALAEKLGVRAGSNGYTLEAVQMAAKRLVDRAESTYSMMSQLFAQKKKTLDSIIQNLRS